MPKEILLRLGGSAASDDNADEEMDKVEKRLNRLHNSAVAALWLFFQK